MVAEKIRIKKYQHHKVDQWCKALSIPDSRFVEDAINFYIQYLSGKQVTAPLAIEYLPDDSLPQTLEPIDTEEIEEYQGGITL